jgi:FkbM family methyltransferase
MNIEIMNDHRFETRENTLDSYVLAEVRRGAYEHGITYAPTDVWLDAGAHIGAFSVTTAHRVRGIVAVEPNPENFAMLKANLAMNEIQNVTPLEAALVTTDATEITLYLNGGKNTGNHSVLAKRGRDGITVPAVNINRVIETAEVNKIKLDVEGAEPALVAAIDWSRIEQLAMEFHHALLLDKDNVIFHEVIDTLQQHFDVVNFKSHDDSKRWTSMVYAR